MPIHDWTRAQPGLFHEFHQSWSVRIKDALVEQKVDGLFLDGDLYTPVPLESTYTATWDVSPEPLRELVAPTS
jgi:hypothetical protein